ncbi:MAG: hypothetical protein LV468_03075 [Candidatus Nitrosotenuis sp.]|nr:hypothetical protein [Candidatus Nitrosotenuis sp.]
MNQQHDADGAIMTFVIEKVLLKIGKPEYDTVISRLETEYGCHIADYHTRLEDLKHVLSDLFGRSYETILHEIKAELGEFSSQRYYVECLRKLGSN